MWTKVWAGSYIKIVRVASDTAEARTSREVGGKSCISSVIKAGVDVHGRSSQLSSGSVISCTNNGLGERVGVAHFWIFAML